MLVFPTSIYRTVSKKCTFQTSLCNNYVHGFFFDFLILLNFLHLCTTDDDVPTSNEGVD